MGDSDGEGPNSNTTLTVLQPALDLLSTGDRHLVFQMVNESLTEHIAGSHLQLPNDSSTGCMYSGKRNESRAVY